MIRDGISIDSAASHVDDDTDSTVITQDANITDGHSTGNVYNA